MQVAPFFHAYSLEWVERYQGTGRRGYREETRDEDRRLLKRYALKFFAADLRDGVARFAAQAALLYVIVSWILTPSASAMLCSRSSPTPL